MSLIQGGSGFNVLCSAVFAYLCGEKLEKISVTMDDVSDNDIASFALKVSCWCIIAIAS